MFQLKKSLNVSENNGIQLIEGLTNPDLLIEITGNETFSGGFLVERSTKRGRVFGIRWIQGSVKGQVIGIEYGSSEILLDIPNVLTDFDLEVIPNRYQFKYQVKISERVFNTAFNALSEKLGIPLEMLRYIPQQTLQILESFNLMASTDIRSMLAAVEAATLSTAQNATTIAAQGVTLADVKATAVVEKNFTLQKAAFVLEGDVYRAPIQHDMGSRFPGVTIYDNDGDLQLAEFIALSETLCKLELTLSQWDANSFPLTVNLQARNAATMAQSVLSAPLGTSGRSVKLVNGSLMATIINGEAIDFDAFRDTPGGAIVNIVEVVVAPNGQFHAKRSDDAYFSGNANEWIGFVSNSGNHDGLKAVMGAIVL